MLGRILFAALAATLLAPNLGVAQLSDPSTYVRQIHQQYIGREPTAYELQYWVDQMNRGMPPREVQAFVISSEAYFDRCQRNVAVWISGAFAQVERRNPSQGERDYWTERLRLLNNNRLMWAKEFLRLSADAPPAASNPPANLPAPPPAGVPSEDLPGRLVTASQLLSQSVATEVTGNSRWLIQLQANNLVTTATSTRELLSKAGFSTNDAVAAVGYLDQALETVHTSLNQLGYTAPNSQHYVLQASDIVTELKRLYPGAGQSPPRFSLPPPPSSPPLAPVPSSEPYRPVSAIKPVAPVTYGAPPVLPSGDLSSSVAEAHQKCRQLVLLVRSRNSREPMYDRLLRDVESMSASIGLFRNNLQFGYELAEQRKHVQNLQQQAAMVERDIQGVTFDAQLAQAWHETTYALKVVAADVGLGQATAASAQQAVPLLRPTFSGLPVNLPTPTSATPVSSEAITAIDQAISQCDALAANYGLYGYYSPSVPLLINELRGQRNVLADLRRQASQVPVGPLSNSLRLVNDQYQRVSARWSEAAASGQFRSAPNLDGLKAAIGRVNQALNWLP